MNVSMSVDINTTPEKVWVYLVVPEKTMKWYSMLEKFEWDSQKRGIGASFYWEERVRGKIYSNHFKTTEWIENKVFAFEMTKGNYFISYTEKWEIKKTSTGCAFSFNDSMVFPYGPLGKIMGWFGERMAQKSSKEMLQNLKVLAEK